MFGGAVDRTNASGDSQFTGKFGVMAGFSVGNPQPRLPNPALKISSWITQRQIEGTTMPCKILLQRTATSAGSESRE